MGFVLFLLVAFFLFEAFIYFLCFSLLTAQFVFTSEKTISQDKAFDEFVDGCEELFHSIRKHCQGLQQSLSLNIEANKLQNHVEKLENLKMETMVV